MCSIEKCRVPGNAILVRYSISGAYTDCYMTEVPGFIALSDFLYIFYTTFLFKLERFILSWTVSKPSTDAQARQLADGVLESFAAWNVEERNENQILMCDFRGRTCSWLMATSVSTDRGTRTRLYFGSAIVPVRNPKTDELSIGLVFQLLLGFHQLYSVLLLYAAKLCLQSQRKTKQWT